MADDYGFLRAMGIMRMLVACMVESEASGGTVQTLELRQLGNLGGAAGLAGSFSREIFGVLQVDACCRISLLGCCGVGGSLS